MSTSPHVHDRELFHTELEALPAASSSSRSPSLRPQPVRAGPSFSQSFLLGPLPKLQTILKHQAACEPDEEQSAFQASSSNNNMDLDDERSESAGCRTRLCG